jgi:hypothetical protein
MSGHTVADLRLSVVVIVPDRFETVARIVAHLLAQTVRERLEIVLASCEERPAIPRDVMAAFGAWSIVRVDGLASTAAARAAATRAARAPLVAFVEDHCFPTPTWADALIVAHERPWAGVGPAVFNANPVTRVSWANLLIEYGPWLAPKDTGDWPHIPGHNSCYKRDVLLSCGDRLDSLMEAESILQWTLQRSGHRFTIEPGAHTRHENFSRFVPSLRLRFHSGRLFAASRAMSWTAAQCLLYALASPLIPFVRLSRAHRDRSRVGGAANKRGLLMVTFVLLVTDAVGEFFGYVTGAGDASEQTAELEFHRERFLTDSDRLQPRGASALTAERA